MASYCWYVSVITWTVVIFGYGSGSKFHFMSLLVHRIKPLSNVTLLCCRYSLAATFATFRPMSLQDFKIAKYLRNPYK